jgi:sulfiredoxin
MQVTALPIDQIRRPLPRQNDPAKVQALMASIADIGQQEPIEILAVGQATVLCRVRRAPRSVLKMHLA